MNSLAEIHNGLPLPVSARISCLIDFSDSPAGEPERTRVLLFLREQGVVYHHRIIGLFQRTVLAGGVNMIAFFEVTEDIIPGSINSLGGEFEVAAAGAHIGIRSQENFQLRIGEYNSTNISAVGHDTAAFAHGLLLLHHSPAHSRDGGYRTHVFAHPHLADITLHIHIIQECVIMAVNPLEVNTDVPKRLFHLCTVVIIGTGIQEIECHCPVHGPGIQIGVMQCFGQRLGQRTFATGGVAVYCNDDLFHKEYAKVANQVTFTIRMDYLFSENISAHLLLWVAVSVAAVQIAFMAWVSIAFRRSSAAPPVSVVHPSISVIICARNEEFNLKKHLPLLLTQEYAGKWELIVVNDASSDDTAALLSEFQKTSSHLRVVTVEKKESPGKKGALSAGIRAASFDWLLFTDADCRPAGNNWLSGMAACMTTTPSTRLVLGYGPLETTKGWLRQWPRWEAIHTAMLYVSLARAGMPYMGVGRNMAIHRSQYEAAGGFSSHEHLASGDDDLLVNAVATRYNTVVCLDPETFMYSAGKTTFRDWLRQKRRHLSTGAHYRRIHQVSLTLLAGTHVMHYLVSILLLFIEPVAGLALWAVRAGACMISFRHVLGVLKAGDLYPCLLLYDVLTAVYYGIFAVWEAVRGLWRQEKRRDIW